MIKKEYMKPVMNVARIQQQHIVCASDGINRNLQSQEVGGAWSRGNRGWEDDDE